MSEDLGAIGSAFKGVGEGINSASEGIDRLVARLQSVAGPVFDPVSAWLESAAAKRRAIGASAAFEASGVDLAECDRRAIAYSAIREMKGFENASETLSMVRLAPDADVNGVEDEWLSTFLDCAEGAFSEWKRRLLAGAMSSKAENPRSLPLGSLHAISRMEARDMDALEKVCATRTVEPGYEGEPVILLLDDELLGTIGLDTESLLRLVDIGVLRRDGQRRRKRAVNKLFIPPEDYDETKMALIVDASDSEAPFSRNVKMRFRTSEIAIEALGAIRSMWPPANHDPCLDLGMCGFTTAGRGLADLIDISTSDSIQKYMELGYKMVSRAERDEIDNGPFEKSKFEQAVKKALNSGLAANR